ncbi:MAG: PAS domain-containing sensor histidine kinase [Natronospirillum sp.]
MHNMKNSSSLKTWLATVFCIAAPLAITAIALRWLDTQDYTVPLLLCLLCVVLVSIHGPRWSGWVCALLSALCFNYFFTAPLGSLAMTHLPDVVAFLVFLACAALISQQTQRISEQTAKSLRADRLLLEQRAASEREQLRFALMSSLSHDLKTPLVTMMVFLCWTLLSIG